MSALQESDDQYWQGQSGGVAPIPQYAVAIATAVPYQGVVGPINSLPLAAVVPVPGQRQQRVQPIPKY